MTVTSPPKKEYLPLLSKLDKRIMVGNVFKQEVAVMPERSCVLSLRIKRLIDFLGALVGLLVLSPIMLAVAILVRIKMGPPVLFRQVRPGLHGKPFVMYKFRTMLDLQDAQGRLFPDEMRLTRLGRILRATSLDELPELFNVLKGEMSLVGPRPLLMEYLPYYTEYEKKRFSVLPGITGWAQINGRNNLPWDERLKLDVWYVENWSLFLDLKILVLTLFKVIKRENVEILPRSVMLDLDKERERQNVCHQ